MQELKKLADRPLSVDIIKMIQANITKNTLEKPGGSGRFRNTDDDNVFVIDERDNTILFEPPSHNEIENRIKNLCDFANTNNPNTFFHPIIKAIIIHFGLSYIHPFVDGNGRTARALFYWYLIKNGYWKFEYLSISRILKKAPAQYARAFLYSEIDDNDITYFVTYNLGAICEAIDEFDGYIKRKLKDQKRMIHFVRDQHGLNIRQAELIDKAIIDSNFSCTIRTIQNTYNVVHQTARTDLIGLVKKGLFVKKRIGREYYFSPVINIKEKLEQMKTK
jgi:Fic family protein